MKHTNGLERDDRCEAPAPQEDEVPCTSFEDAYGRYKHFVWKRILRKVGHERVGDAEDIFQNVFAKLDERIRGGDMPRRMAPALLTLIDNAVHVHRRAEGRRRIDGEPEADRSPSSKPDPEQLLGLAEDRAGLAELVETRVFARMTPYEVQLIRLVHIDELPGREVARIVGRTEGAVRTHLCKARARFWELAAPLLRRRSGGDT